MRRPGSSRLWDAPGSAARMRAAEFAMPVGRLSKRIEDALTSRLEPQAPAPRPAARPSQAIA